MGQEEVLWTVVDITERVEAQNRIEELASKLSSISLLKFTDQFFSGQKNVQIEANRKKLTVFFSDIKILQNLLTDLNRKYLVHC